jgi:multidrug efflux pump subunit AcrB
MGNRNHSLQALKMVPEFTQQVYEARWLALPIILICGGIIFFLGKDLQSELAPMEDKSAFRLSVTAPEGTSYDAMDKYMDKIATFLMDSMPEKKIITSMTAPGFTGSGSANPGL